MKHLKSIVLFVVLGASAALAQGHGGGRPGTPGPPTLPPNAVGPGIAPGQLKLPNGVGPTIAPGQLGLPPNAVGPPVVLGPPVVVAPPVLPAAAIGPPVMAGPPVLPAAAVGPPVMAGPPVLPAAAVGPPVMAGPPVLPAAAVGPPVMAGPPVLPAAAAGPPVMAGAPVLPANAVGPNNGRGPQALPDNAGGSNNGRGPQSLQADAGGSNNGRGPQALPDNAGGSNNGRGPQSANAGGSNNGRGPQDAPGNAGGSNNGRGPQSAVADGSNNGRGPQDAPAANAGGPNGLDATPQVSGAAPEQANSPVDVQVTPPPNQLGRETVAQSIEQAIQRDVVGRPRDSRILSQTLARNNLSQMVVRNEILAVSPSPASLAIARQLDFTITRRDTLDALGMNVVTLAPPPGMAESQALARLRAADPSGSYDFAHIYEPTGDSIAPSQAAPQSPAVKSAAVIPAEAGSVRIGMIDGGVARAHSALRNASLVVRNFSTSGDAPGTVHGTAVASLLVGRDQDFSGFLPGATLYTADVFGGAADGGSAVKIARALDWLAANNIAVANISLAGPPNALLAAAVKAFIAGGHVVVAAVGNDGPAAPVKYPAAYPGVVAVTSVDAERRLQIDANRGQATFAAPGVDVRTAALPQGYVDVTGTSFAAPVVSARLGLLVKAPAPDAGQKAVTELKQDAVPLKEADRVLSYVGPPMSTAPHAPTLATR